MSVAGEGGAGMTVAREGGAGTITAGSQVEVTLNMYHAS
jgi:hypothetical protein